jgi:hypothetical protein
LLDSFQMSLLLAKLFGGQNERSQLVELRLLKS